MGHLAQEARAMAPPDVAPALDRLAALAIGLDGLPEADRRTRIRTVRAEVARLQALADPGGSDGGAGPTSPADPGPGILPAPPVGPTAPEAGAAPRPAPPPPTHDPDAPLSSLKGVGPRTLERLSRLGLETLRDLLLHLPRDYQDRSGAPSIASLELGQEGLVVGEVTAVRTRGSRKGTVLEVAVADGSGTAIAVWFRAPARMAQSFEVGRRVGLYGTVDRMEPAPTLFHPDRHDPDGRGVLPIYPATQGFGQRQIRALVAAALDAAAAALPDRVPAPVREARDLPPYGEALWRLHRPEPEDDLGLLRAGTSPAHRAVLFQELFGLQLALAMRRRGVKGRAGLRVAARPGLVREVMDSLPFDLTGAQRRAVQEVHRDLASGRPMCRLLQGDVGCGKTLVALLGALPVIEAGGQVAIMAPTEILAEQHLHTFGALLAPLGYRAVLLSGSLRARPRREALEHCAAGTAQLGIGTQALFQGDVAFRNLSMIVVDEQHRFGVDQRAALAEKGIHPSGAHPHLLAMTATPIPRSLALTLYGDLDLTVIDEMPPRGEVTTVVLPDERRGEAYAEARRAAEEGGRVFVVYPLVEAKENSEVRDAVSMAEELATGPLRGVPLALLHGRMDPFEKERIVDAFRRGDVRVLVTTTVVEVGVDVREATCMVVEGADRFGLAQLHQLRGRIGRNRQPGRCLLVARSGKSAERLKILEATRSGFDIAESDLRLRGPGDLIGLRQSGRPVFALSASPSFSITLAAARAEAFALVERPDFLDDPAYAPLRDEVRRHWGRSLHLHAG